MAGAKEKLQSPEVRIKAEISKSGFLGECLSYEVTLMSTDPDISNVRIIRSPEFPEGVTVIQGVVRNNRPERVEEKGKTYYCWTILRNFIIPSKSGKFTVTGGEYVVFIPHERMVYHDFWGPRRAVEYEEQRVDCKSVSFKVSPLPANKTGKEFSGCIGDFRIEGWFPPGKITPGNEAYAVFTISGYGSLEELKMPNIYKIFHKGCHMKEVEQNEERMQRDGKLYSEITLTCRFVADNDEFEIAPLCMLMFNPSTGKYEEVCSEALHWTNNSSEKKSSKPSNDAIAI